MKEKILLVDDELDIIEFLKYNLEEEGFKVITADNGEEAIKQMSDQPDLIVLDIMMPNMDGFEVCSKIRKMKGFEQIPIIFLTAKSSETDEVYGLNIGADDFIQKPVSIAKIIARIKSNLRKVSSSKKTSVTNNKTSTGPLTVDRDQYLIYLNGDKLVLPKKEFEIIDYLAGNPGKVFSRNDILRDIWGENVYVVDRTIDVHVRKIREKFGRYSNLIETVKGVGYRFKNVE